MSNDRNSIIGKIKKLLRTARDSAASRGEVENALSAARRLMDRHAIEENDIAEAATTDVVESYESKPRRGAGWLHELHCVVAHLTETKAISKMIRGARSSTFGFAGCKSDPEVALEMFKSLVLIAKSFAKREARVCERSYLHGFVDGLAIASIRARKESLEGSVECTAIVAKKEELINAHIQTFSVKRHREAPIDSLNLGDVVSGFRRGKSEGIKIKDASE